MKKSQSKIQSGYIKLVLIVTIVAVACVGGLIVWQTRPAKVVSDKQADFIDGIERRSAARMRRLVAESYGDRWGFDRDDIVMSIVDLGSQFMTLVVTPENQTLSIDESVATVTLSVTLGGRSVGPGGGEVTRRINQLDDPFVFTWEKESFLPTSWRLVRIEQPELPDELFGYEPGDIRRAMGGE
ncbi:MAG: hypothetical protein AAGA96_19055 [Verrucomicrobiota bacterium]